MYKFFKKPQKGRYGSTCHSTLQNKTEGKTKSQLSKNRHFGPTQNVRFIIIKNNKFRKWKEEQQPVPGLQSNEMSNVKKD